MARNYYFSFGRNRWDPTPLIVAVMVVVLAAALYAYFKTGEVRAEEGQSKAVAAAVDDLRKEADAVKVSIDLPGKMRSANYILLQRSGYNRKFEGEDSWVDAQEGVQPVPDAFMHQRIRLAKKANVQIYPASMTKMLTALVFIERIAPGDYDKELEITRDDLGYLYNDGASVAGFAVGEKVKIEDLIYGVMLPSGSECTSALAEYMAGGQDKFVDMMNAKAESIGMSASHFSNPIGLHDDETYTTVSDIALLLDYAIRDERFLKVISTQEYTTSPTNKHPDGLDLKSTLYQQGEIDMVSDDGEIIGGKTGYTNEAGQCLASYMVKGGEQFILVTAAAKPKDFHKQALHVNDMLDVFSALEVTGAGIK
ncbi:MAG: serine hydrolase [Clostridiales Family XIII bacterium]|jgi:D-alanyl-D-alanine carboxypeptidase (penicillin-binding protein 5/6)|nr:serine hydrolase [Clostridiales Family XIII bacterium]